MNKDYSLCQSYPSLLAVPAVSDDIVKQEAVGWLKLCLPVLSWQDMFYSASITCCPQSHTGITGKVFDLDQECMGHVRQTNTTNLKTLFILVNKAKITFFCFILCV